MNQKQSISILLRMVSTVRSGYMNSERFRKFNKALKELEKIMKYG